MSNCETFLLPRIDAVEPSQVRDVLRCLLHTILFNRALGVVRLKEVDIDYLDVTYVRCDDRDVSQAVESGIHDFCAAIERRPPAAPIQVQLAFYEKRQKASWFGTADDYMYWEQWLIPLSIMSHAEALERSMQIDSMGLPKSPSSHTHNSPTAQLTNGLQAALSYISRCVSEKRGHLPPVVSSAVMTYPFLITATIRDGRSSFSLGNVKKLLMQTSPPPMLG